MVEEINWTSEEVQEAQNNKTWTLEWVQEKKKEEVDNVIKAADSIIEAIKGVSGRPYSLSWKNPDL